MWGPERGVQGWSALGRRDSPLPLYHGSHLLSHLASSMLSDVAPGEMPLGVRQGEGQRVRGAQRGAFPLPQRDSGRLQEGGSI